MIMDQIHHRHRIWVFLKIHICLIDKYYRLLRDGGCKIMQFRCIQDSRGGVSRITDVNQFGRAGYFIGHGFQIMNARRSYRNLNNIVA